MISEASGGIPCLLPLAEEVRFKGWFLLHRGDTAGKEVSPDQNCRMLLSPHPIPQFLQRALCLEPWWWLGGKGEGKEGKLLFEALSPPDRVAVRVCQLWALPHPGSAPMEPGKDWDVQGDQDVCPAGFPCISNYLLMNILVPCGSRAGSTGVSTRLSSPWWAFRWGPAE